jgi:glycerophosphoryl diester phosphodiesterase
MSISKILLSLVAIAVVTLSAINASWVASRPSGPLILVAHRGVAQPIDRDAAGGDCDARHLLPSDHTFVENTLFSMQNAVHFGADGLMLDVRTSADGRAIIFRDARLECRTNGTGAVGERPLAYLKSLDIGYGYSADNGHTFPLRGRPPGGMATAEEVIRAFPRSRLIFELEDARAADALIADFGRAGVPIGELHGFIGDASSLAHLRQLTRAGWILDRAAGDACLSSYRATGWLGLVPASCRGLTLALPRKGEWTLWGWPYRFMDRMQGVGAYFLIAGDSRGDAVTGLDQPEQLNDVPRLYAGMLLIEDMYQVGRSLRH